MTGLAQGLIIAIFIIAIMHIALALYLIWVLRKLVLNIQSEEESRKRGIEESRKRAEATRKARSNRNKEAGQEKTPKPLALENIEKQ